MQRAPFIVLVVVLLCIAAGPAVGDAAEAVSADSAILQLIEQVDVPARVPGQLISVAVREGDLVDQGAPVAQIEDGESKLLYRQALVELELSVEQAANNVAIRSAQRSLDFARAEDNRLERAAVELPGSVSISECEQAKHKVDQAELDIERAQLESRLDKLKEKLKRQELDLGKYRIGMKKIMAPLPGVVVEVLRHQGEWVEPGDKVVRIVGIDRLRAEGLLHVRHVTSELKGKPATVVATIPGQPEVKCTGEIVFVSPEVNPVNGLVRISVEFENPDRLLRPGLRAKITIP
jgi:macrolide-specific efflux system membrane fusion protein